MRGGCELPNLRGSVALQGSSALDKEQGHREGEVYRDSKSWIYLSGVRSHRGGTALERGNRAFLKAERTKRALQTSSRNLKEQPAGLAPLEWWCEEPRGPAPSIEAGKSGEWFFKSLKIVLRA